MKSLYTKIWSVRLRAYVHGEPNKVQQTCTYMGNRIRLEIVWLRINRETVQTQAK